MKPQFELAETTELLFKNDQKLKNKQTKNPEKSVFLIFQCKGAVVQLSQLLVLLTVSTFKTETWKRVYKAVTMAGSSRLCS